MVRHHTVNVADVGSTPTLPAKVEVDFERLQNRVIDLYCNAHFSGGVMHGTGVDRTLSGRLISPAKREGRTMLETITQVLALVLLIFNAGGACKADLAYAKTASELAPMNTGLDSLGVKDYDRSLCNDKWNHCSGYDKATIGSRYPGQSLDELGKYPTDSSGHGAKERRYSPYEDRSSKEYSPWDEKY